MATTLTFRDNRLSLPPLALAHDDVHALQVYCAVLRETGSREQCARRHRKYVWPAWHRPSPISKNVSIIYGLVDHILVHKSCTGPVQPYINFQFMYKTIYY